MRWKIITVLIITSLICAWIYLRTIGLFGDLETLIFSLLSIILPLIIPYCFQPRVVLKIENIRLDKKQVNHNIGYYLKATMVNKGKKIGLNIDAHFDIKNDLDKSPHLLYVATETMHGQKNVSIEEKPFNEQIGYAWVLDKKGYQTGSLKELRHGDKVDLLFPYHPFGFGLGGQGSFKWFESEYLLKLERGKKYKVKIAVKGEDSEKNTVEATKKGKIKV